MMEAGRGLGNITEKFLQDILSTTDQAKLRDLSLKMPVRKAFYDIAARVLLIT